AGIDVTLQSVENSALITDVLFGKYQVADFSVYSSPDPDQYRYFWGSQTALGAGKLSINFTQYTSPEIDKGLDVVRQSGDFDTRKAATDKIVDQINGSATNIWMYWTPYSIVSQGRVHGMQGAATQHMGNFQPKSFMQDVWIKKHPLLPVPGPHRPPTGP